MSSTADVVHLDFLRLGHGAPQLLAQLAVAVSTAMPDAADQLKNVRIAGAGTQRCAQIETVSREQAGVEFALRGQTRPAAGTAKWLRSEEHTSELQSQFH